MHISVSLPFFLRGLSRCRNKPTLSLICLFPSFLSSPPQLLMVASRLVVAVFPEPEPLLSWQHQILIRRLKLIYARRIPLEWWFLVENIVHIPEEYWEKEHQEGDVAWEAMDVPWPVRHRRMVVVEVQVPREDCLAGEGIVIDSEAVCVS